MLKKISLIILLLICTVLFSNKANALSGNYFSWNKTEISIPLNSNFEDYLKEFKVTYYYKGEKTDLDVIIGIDPFYYGNLSISTNKVCTKTVKLKATIIGYSTSEKKDIIVHVIDNEMPTITLHKELIFNVNEIINYEDYFDISDNDEIASEQFIYSDINTSVPGVYPLEVIVADKSGNMVTKKYSVTIEDKTAPIITAKAYIEVNYGDKSFDIRNYVKATDVYDGDLTSSVTVDNLDVFKIGSQDVIISVKDSSGNTKTIVKTVEVVDRSAPKLDLSTYFLQVDITQSDIDFKRYIASVSDDVDNLSIDDVEIDCTEFKKELGTHTIIYSVHDKSGNYSVRKLNIDVCYQNSPEIQCENLTFNINTNFDLRDYVTVTDIYDKDIKNSLIIDDTTIDKTKEGVYEVILEATNLAGNTTTKSIFVTIKDNNKATESEIHNVYDFVYDHKKEGVIAIITICVIGFIYYMKKKKNKAGI